MRLYTLAAQLTQWEDRLRPQPVEHDPGSPASPTEANAIAAHPTDSSGTAEGSPPSLTPDQRKRAIRLVKKLRQESLPRLAKYEAQRKTLGDRNRFSKTDPDATFMRMKDDHLNKGQLKPAYHGQIGTENQFIVGFSVHQRPGDTLCLILHWDHLKQQLGQLPQTIVADAGYGSKENNAYLDHHRRTAVVKFNTYRLEKTPRWKAQIKRVEKLKPADRISVSHLVDAVPQWLADHRSHWLYGRQGLPTHRPFVTEVASR